MNKDQTYRRKKDGLKFIRASDGSKPKDNLQKIIRRKENVQLNVIQQHRESWTYSHQFIQL